MKIKSVITVVDTLLNSWTQGENPGAAVIVIHQGRIVHKKAPGSAGVPPAQSGTRLDARETRALPGPGSQFSSGVVKPRFIDAA